MNSHQACGLNRKSPGHSAIGINASTVLTFLLLLTMAAFARAGINDGLSLHYPGCAALDQSGNANNGQVYGKVGCVDGINGSKAFKFFGPSSPGWIAIPAGKASLHVTNAFSYAFRMRIDGGGMDGWGRTSSPEGSTHAVIARDHDRGTYAMVASVGVDGKVHVGPASDVMKATPAIDAAIPQGQWFHVVYAYGNGRAAMYLNGVLQSEGASDIPLAAANARDILLGAYSGGYWYPANISLGEVRVYNRQITAQDAYELSAGNFASSNAGSSTLSISGSDQVTAGASVQFTATLFETQSQSSSSTISSTARIGSNVSATWSLTPCTIGVSDDYCGGSVNSHDGVFNASGAVSGSSQKVTLNATFVDTKTGDSHTASKTLTILPQATIQAQATPSLTGLSLNCPQTVVGGHAAGSCSAMASYSDKSTNAVKPTWISSDSATLTIDADGLLTAKSGAKEKAVLVTAIFSDGSITKTNSSTITVIPDAASVACSRECTSIKIDGDAVKHPGDSLAVTYAIDGYDSATRYSVYIVVVTPTNDTFFMVSNGFFQTPAFVLSEATPYQKATLLPKLEGPVLTIPQLSRDLPSGTYQFQAVVTKAGANLYDPFGWIGSVQKASFTLTK